MTPAQRIAVLYAFSKSGRWKEALKWADAMIADGVWNPSSYYYYAVTYIRLLSMNEENDRVEPFFATLPQRLLNNDTYHQMVLHFRRIGDEQKELEIGIERVKADAWRNVDGLLRFCGLLHRHKSAAERIEILLQLRQYFQSKATVQVILFLSYDELGMESEARELAAALLPQKYIGKGGFESNAAFRAYLQTKIDGVKLWPTAKELKPIPAQYKMYLQPVGEYDRALLEEAARQAGEFFGCEFIVRDAIPVPESRSIFRDDLSTYLSLPVLRRVAMASPPPKDAIYQAYLVEKRFMVRTRGEVSNYYDEGLGYMFTDQPVQDYHKTRQAQLKALKFYLIYGFHHFIDQLASDITPNSYPCANSRAIDHSTIDYKNGYCLECTRLYQELDMQQVFQYTQSFPRAESYQPYYHHEYPVDAEELKSIQDYVARVKASR